MTFVENKSLDNLNENTDDFFSVYVHIPFCSHRCDYCDFATWTDKEDSIDIYIQSLLKQFEYHKSNQEKILNKKLRSIFFGGGTPNLIDPKYIGEIISKVFDSAGEVAQDCEVTVECNPDLISLAQMETYKNSGVNRISVGVQSSNQSVLDYLGRRHQSDQVLGAIDNILSSGISNFSCDLIYGSGNESLKIYEQSLQDIISYGPNHISAYALGIEKGTPLYKSIKDGVKKNINEDDLADKYELTEEILNDHGFSWYEISNWSKPNYESKHNLSYWRGVEVIALGCAAHGHTENKRWATPRDIDRYVNKFKNVNIKDDFSELFVEIRDNEIIDASMEKFALQLRTKYGVYWPRALSSTGVTELIDDGFCDYDEEKEILTLSLKGRLMAHSITISLYDIYKNAILL